MNRQVFLFTGFDPSGAQPDLEFLQDQFQKFQQISGETGPDLRFEIDMSADSLSAIIDGPSQRDVRCSIELAPWAPIFRSHAATGPWERMVSAARYAVRMVASGHIVRLFKISSQYGMVTLYPIVALVLCSLAGLIAGGIIHAFSNAAFGPLSVFTATILYLAGAMAGLLAGLSLPRRTFVTWLLDIGIYLDRLAGRDDAAVEQMVARQAGRLIATDRTADSDEILVVGHSIGAIHAVRVVGRALALDPEFGKRGAKIALMTLGNLILHPATDPRDTASRQDIALIHGAKHIFWVDYGDRRDRLSFAWQNPVRVLGLAEDSKARRPAVRACHFGAVFDPQELDARSYDLWHLHSLYLRAVERAGEYGLFEILTDPRPLRRRIEHFRKLGQGFRPPAPVPPPKKLTIPQAVLRGRKDLLSVFPEAAYYADFDHAKFGRRDFFLVTDPDLVRHIMVDNYENYPKSRPMYKALNPLIGDGIFISNGELWKEQRQMIDPAFEKIQLTLAYPAMVAAVDDFLDRLATRVDGTPVEINAELAHVTADIIFRTIFSAPLTAAESRYIFDAFDEYQQALPQFDMVELLGFPDWVPRRRMGKAKAAGAKIRDVLRAKIEARLAAPSSPVDPEAKRDILDVLIAARKPGSGEPFTLEELVDETGVLFLAGHETSASALTWAIYLLTKQPRHIRRLRAECETVLGDRGIAYGDIAKLKFARNLLRETLRLYPPVSFISRDAIAADRLGDQEIKPGSLMVISPWIIHRHRFHWHRPNIFDPDRFDTPEGKISARKVYLPFGMGPRVCSGASFAMLEGSLILASLFRRFDLELKTEGEIKPVCRLTTRTNVSLEFQVKDIATQPTSREKTVAAPVIS